MGILPFSCTGMTRLRGTIHIYIGSKKWINQSFLVQSIFKIVAQFRKVGHLALPPPRGYGELLLGSRFQSLGVMLSRIKRQISRISLAL